MSTAKETIAKINKVIMEQNWPRTLIGKSPAMRIMINVVMMDPATGERVLGEMFPNVLERRPSRPIAKKIRVCVKMSTRTTDAKPAKIATLMRKAIHKNLAPMLARATAMGSATLSEVYLATPVNTKETAI